MKKKKIEKKYFTQKGKRRYEKEEIKYLRNKI